MSTRRGRRLAPIVAVAGALALTACSPGSSGGGGGGTDDEGVTTVTFRLWDEAAAAAYEESFAAFTEQHPEIRVEIEQVPWANYWEQLPLDLQAGEMADIFWTNTSNFGRYADAGNLLDITEVLGEDHDEWNPAAVELYERNGSLWGVPQLSDSIALLYNKTLLDEAGIDPTTLAWSPNPDEDTLLPALQQLTTDSAGVTAAEEGFDPDDVAVWGFNAQNDLQAIWLDFLAQNGGVFQDGDSYAFSSPEGVEAFTYLVDLINTHHVAPPAADTNANGDLSRELFVQGKLALFQTGQYSLPFTADIGDSFEWGVAPMIAGPEGRIGVVHAVAALGNADTEHPDEVAEVLRWIGSAEGQSFLAESGAAFPAAVEAQQTFTDYWNEQGVDTTPFLEQAAGPSVSAPLGPNSNAGLEALGGYFPDMFAGLIPVADALAQAQDAANEAIAE
ncbi:MAG TPA: sugar ABC transporter substrate-binding protein [Actinotalea caeni]|uniref:ABC transporter substrate-binding protein n=1 Tax=Actinotalea caeni TaxID=1348467 RepID=UPI002B4AD8BE|nr:sugar ABC transporter substrate-binding protein [Actinotalea caeni]HLV55608.1 sugar ABC transporter substrate-binding protein [Actinotalea caeni]